MRGRPLRTRIFTCASASLKAGPHSNRNWRDVCWIARTLICVRFNTVEKPIVEIEKRDHANFGPLCNLWRAQKAARDSGQ